MTMGTLFGVLQPLVHYGGIFIMLTGGMQIGLTLKDGAGGGGQLYHGIALAVAGALIAAVAMIPKYTAS